MVIGSCFGGCDGGMKKVILFLVLGMFGLGMVEFGIMGVFMELVYNVGILIFVVGYMILYYVLGVVVGVLIIVFFFSCYLFKYILLFLVVLCVIGNVMFMFFLFYLMFVIGWLVFGFLYGVFFGVGVIVLLKIIKFGKVIVVVVGMVFGMIVVNLLGILLGMYLSQEFSWCYIFLLIVVFNIVVMVLVYFWVLDICDEVKGNLCE